MRKKRAERAEVRNLTPGKQVCIVADMRERKASVFRPQNQCWAAEWWFEELSCRNGANQNDERDDEPG